MKLQNYLIQLFGEFLTLEDVIHSQLGFVNKQFYKNLVQDERVIKKAVINYLGVIGDIHKEQEYQTQILKKMSDVQGQELEEQKGLEGNLCDLSLKQLLDLISECRHKTDIKLLLCAYKVTGGGDGKINSIFRMFTEDSILYRTTHNYCTDYKNFAITGIIGEENYTDVAEAQRLLQQAIDCGRLLKLDQSEVSSDPKKRLPIEASELTEEEAKEVELCPEDVSSTNPKLLNYWLRNGLMYSPGNYVLEKDLFNINELDSSLHQVLTKDKLFCWNRFVVHPAEGYLYQVKYFAIFAHDYPMPAHHPLQMLARDNWGEFDYNRGHDSFGSDIADKVEQYNDELEDYGDIKLWPDELQSTPGLIEFDQSFYKKLDFNLAENSVVVQLEKIRKKLCGEGLDYNTAIPGIYDTEKGLDATVDYLRLRLVAVVRKLDYNNPNEFCLKQHISSRYITVTALDPDDLYGIDEHEIEFQSMTFYGHAIPSSIKAGSSINSLP